MGGSFDWSQHRLDQDKLKRDYPEVWDACRKEINVRKFYLIDGDEEES
jgi:hypothetical protein